MGQKSVYTCLLVINIILSNVPPRCQSVSHHTGGTENVIRFVTSFLNFAEVAFVNALDIIRFYIQKEVLRSRGLDY